MAARVDVERTNQLADRPRRLVGGVEMAVAKPDGKQDDERATYDAGHQEHGQLVAVDHLDQVGAGHGGERGADAENAGHGAALRDRHLVRQNCYLCGEQGVEENLGDAPADEHPWDARRGRDDHRPCCAAREADQHPGSAHPHPRGGAVTESTEQRIGDHRQHRAGTGDQGEVPRGVVDADEVFDLQRQGDEQRGDEDQGIAGERQGVQRDKAPPDTAGRARASGGASRFTKLDGGDRRRAIR